MIDRNILGDRGESIFYLAVSSFHQGAPLFRAASLGGKWPVADMSVELENQPGMFFLVQVKTSSRGYTKDQQRLLISAGQAQLQKLADAPLPTYLIGVDEPGANVYLTAIYGQNVTARSSIATTHSLNDADVRVRLYNEVKEFWDGVRQSRPWQQSAFSDSESEANRGPK